MTPTEPRKRPGPVGRAFRALYEWIVPVRLDSVGGQRVLVYTSFPKAFYFYLLWLPGFVVLGLNAAGYLGDAAVVWWMFAFAVLTYLVIAEDTGPMGFLVLVLAGVTSVVLYSAGWLDWAGAQRAAEELRDLRLALDPGTLLALNCVLFVAWALIYLFAVTWKKRELSSLRRAKLRPPLGRKPLPIVGRVVDNQVRDVFELIFGFGSYDVEISYPGGKTIEVDKNCVGLALKLREFSDLISKIPTREEFDGAVAVDDEVIA